MSEYILHSDDQALQSRILPYILKNRLFDVVWALGKIKEAQDKSSLVIVSEYEYRTMYDSRLAGLAGFLKTL